MAVRVLLANYRYFVSGGSERYLFNVKKGLEQYGHSVVPFSIRYERNEPSEYERFFVDPLDRSGGVYFEEHGRDAVTLVRTLRRLFYAPEVQRAVSRLIAESRPDVAYVLHYLRKLSPALLVAVKRAKLPLVVRLSDFQMVCPQAHCLRDGAPCTKCVSGSLVSSIRYRCVKGSLPASVLGALATWFHRSRGYFDLVDQFVVTNEFTYDLMRQGGIEASRLTVIETFGDLARFSPTTSEAKRERVVAYVGRLDPIKGIETLLDGFAGSGVLAAQGVRLLVAGEGRSDYERSLRRRVEASGASDRVEFLGSLAAEQVVALLRRARVSVMPSLWYENLPNVVIESLACGTPVLVSRLGSLPGLIEEGRTGLSFTPGDPGDLRSKLEKLYTLAAQTAEVHVTCRQQAEQRFSEGAHMGRLLGLFERLISENSGGRTAVAVGS